MASFTCIIFGKQRSDTALIASRTLALSVPNAFGYELWSGGEKVSGYFSPGPLIDDTRFSKPAAAR